jgi:4'-phosphopantetheinyl transferase
MQMQPAPTRPPAWGEINVHLWWQATRPEDDVPRARRARLDRLLRNVLSRYTGSAPESLQFAREARGRPFLLGPDVPDFNLSDTIGGSLLAVAAQGRVGVDLERCDRRLSHRRLAERYFSAQEHEALQGLTDTDARAAFLRLWTAKEASCKATGTGIYGLLDRWIFAARDEVPRLLALPPEAGSAEAWHHLRLIPAPGYSAALACHGWAPHVCGFTLEQGTDRAAR